MEPDVSGIYLMAEMPSNDGGNTYVFYIQDCVSLTVYVDANKRYSGWDCPNLDNDDEVQPYLDAAGEILESQGKMING
jgi:hypothetical protein